MDIIHSLWLVSYIIGAIGYIVWVVVLTVDYFKRDDNEWYEIFFIPFEPIVVWYFTSRINGMIKYLKDKKWINKKP